MRLGGCNERLAPDVRIAQVPLARLAPDVRNRARSGSLGNQGHYDWAAMGYFERLRALSAERNTMLCVGLDPDPERIEGGAAGPLRPSPEAVRQTEDPVCSLKPTTAPSAR